MITRAHQALYRVVPGEEELGEQKECPRCGDHWPARDETFWMRRRSRPGWYAYCRACCYEHRSPRRRDRAA